MKLKANAKINLALNIIGKNDKGYHELDMIMVPINISDIINIELSNKDEVIFVGNNKISEDNTVSNAIKFMKNKFNIKECFKVIVNKRIPAQAGLGGGSSDAAATIRGIINLLDLKVDLDALAKETTVIGADVPFCLINKPARVRGIGEIITKFDIISNFGIILIKPSSGVSTKEAFANVDYTEINKVDIALLVSMFEKGLYKDVSKIVKNDLEKPSMIINEEINLIRQELYSYGYEYVLMSGSGSSVFALSEDTELLNKTYLKMKDKYEFVRVCNVE